MALFPSPSATRPIKMASATRSAGSTRNSALPMLDLHCTIVHLHPLLQPIAARWEIHRCVQPLSRRVCARFERILKRREERLRREAIRPNQPRQKVRVPRQKHAAGMSLAVVLTRPVCSLAQYLHESRHKHAISRVRGKKGRFVNQNDDQPPNRRSSDSSDSLDSSFSATLHEHPELHPAREPTSVLALPPLRKNSVLCAVPPTSPPGAMCH